MAKAGSDEPLHWPCSKLWVMPGPVVSGVTAQGDVAAFHIPNQSRSCGTGDLIPLPEALASCHAVRWSIAIGFIV